MPNNTLADSEVDDRTEPMTTPLDELKAALEAFDEAKAVWTDACRHSDDPLYFDKRERYVAARDALHALLTDDTIAALIAVAEAAQRHLGHGAWVAPDLVAALAPLVKEVEDAACL